MRLTALIVGSAPCLYTDVARALELRPFSALFLLNGACTAIENAEHVIAGHAEKAEFFARARRERFPNAPAWRLHGSCHAHRVNESRYLYPSVTDWHPPEHGPGATTASLGAKLALCLGFDEAILCGSPLDGSGYFPGEACVPQQSNCLRVGDATVQDARIIRGYRARFGELARSEFKGRVFSMSGYTRDCLGEPASQR